LNGTPVFFRRILTLSLTTLVALGTAACFNIILAEPTALQEDPPAVNDAMIVVPVLGDVGPQAEPQSRRQESDNVDAPDLDSAIEILVPPVVPLPTATSTAAPLPAYQLSINGAPVVDSMLALKGGTVEVSAPLRDPPGLFWKGDQVSLNATPEDGYQFYLWGGDCSSVGNVCILAIDGNLDLNVGFVPADGLFFSLDLTVGPDGGGEVQIQPPPNAPDGRYLAGTHLELRALDSEGFGFVGWDGACLGDEQECRIVMDGDMSVSASFEPDFYTLTINRVLLDSAGAAIGNGHIAVFPFVYSPSNGFARSAVVSLTPDPDPGYVLVSWGGDCSGVEPDATGCTLNMDGDKVVEVTFTEESVDRDS